MTTTTTPTNHPTTSPRTSRRASEDERESATERERARVLASQRHFREKPRYGECLAIARTAFDSMFYFGGPPPTQRTPEGIAIVSVQGPLEHHSTWCWDNYEDLLDRVEGAMSGQDVCRQHERMNGWREGFEPIDASPARAVVLCIDSPGGEASGAMYVQRKLHSLRKQYDVPLYAYANEMACSAAYSIACGADEIWTCDTGTLGSIGVVATLFDRTSQNEKVGIDIQLVTSGAYKADNHADRVLTDDIVSRMQARVDTMADVFFKVVAHARETSPKAIAELEAGVFIGRAAVEVGLADGVARWDHFLKIVADSLEPAAPSNTPAT